jgi:hypothetical protein
MPCRVGVRLRLALPLVALAHRHVVALDDAGARTFTDQETQPDDSDSDDERRPEWKHPLGEHAADRQRDEHGNPQPMPLDGLAHARTMLSVPNGVTPPDRCI